MKSNVRPISVFDNIKIIDKQMKEIGKEAKDIDKMLVSVKNHYNMIFDKMNNNNNNNVKNKKL